MSARSVLQRRGRRGRLVDHTLAVDVGGEPWVASGKGEFSVDDLDVPVPFGLYRNLRDSWTLDGTFNAWGA